MLKNEIKEREGRMRARRPVVLEKDGAGARPVLAPDDNGRGWTDGRITFC
ncbi:hypothetical protein GEV33_000380 [Tenebrio molitor]|uniref:Uncharacterized protein n=1 Tax=Tenebrio molitor TaxID=7067 RepID=A0A8J6LR15_TENMO|nr:hypothetical protein GEV33_000380 [Tenebrio molitor]